MQWADGATVSVGSLLHAADELALRRHHLSTYEWDTACLMTLLRSVVASRGPAVLLACTTTASMGKIGVTDDDSIVVC